MSKPDDLMRGLELGKLFAAGRVEEEITRLKSENAKLRELVEDMLDCIEIRAAFGRPPTSEMYEELARRAYELGVDAKV
jgi:hypothetical protein